MARSGAAVRSRAILNGLGEAGRLIAFDKDPLAVATAQQIEDSRFSIVRDSFAALRDAASERGVARVSVCCWVWACRRRRWTTRIAASVSGAKARSTCGWTRLAASRRPSGSRGQRCRGLTEVIRDYGEERFAFQIARRLLLAGRSPTVLGALGSTSELAEIVVTSSKPVRRARTRQLAPFEAIRIHINQGCGAAGST